MKKGLRATVCASAMIASGILGAGTAVAQEAPQNSADQAAQASPEATAGDIVVTAQRRAERAEKVPIAITTISPEIGEKLNIRDLQTLQIVTPGLSVTTGNGYAQTYIRGVGANFSNPGVENPVAVYIDGAYVTRGQGGNVDVVDVASVQVLKGPQGTLWGRNATGGAILVTTADPEFNVGGRLVGEFGSQEHRLIEGNVNVPLSDTLAIRVAGRYRSDGGYIRNLPDDYMFGWKRDSTLRGKLLWEPSAEFKAVISAQHESSKNSLGPNAQFLPDAYCLDCSRSAYTHPYADPYTTAISLLNNGVGNVTKSDLYTAKLSYTADKFNITNTTTYSDSSAFVAYVTNLTEVPSSVNFVVPATYETFTQNVTATSDFGGVIEGMIGLDYLSDSSTYIINFVSTLSPPFPEIPRNHIKTNSISPYGEINIKPLPGLTLTAGGRYTRDVRRGSHVSVPNQRATFTSFSPRLVVAYETGPFNLYASFNRGNKAGGFNSTGVPMQVFEPETLTAYEVGAKFVSNDRTLRANIAFFHYDYDQLQTLSIDQGNQGSIGRIQNPNAKLDGIDFDANWKPTEWLDLLAGATYLHTEYRNFRNAQIQVPTFDANGNPNGLTTGTEDLSGTRLPHAPKFTAFLGATLSADLSTDWKGYVTGLVNYSSDYDFFPGAGGPLRLDRQAAYTTARLSGAIMPIDEKFEIGFYINNLTNAKTYNFRFTAAPFGALEQIDRPRTYGLRVAVKY